jgi:hypothetical protein
MKMPPIGYLGIAAIGIYLVNGLLSFGSAKPLCNAIENLERIGCGDKILLVPPGGKSRRDKELGFAAIKLQDYPQAIESLQRDWDMAKDPETLIALNNAKGLAGK